LSPEPSPTQTGRSPSRVAGLGVAVADGEDCAVGKEELLHAATISTTVTIALLICRLKRWILNASYCFCRELR
jgi:hypothetical protein